MAKKKKKRKAAAERYITEMMIPQNVSAQFDAIPDPDSSYELCSVNSNTTNSSMVTCKHSLK
jgi:hypothetical protein